ncbi:MAG: ParB N-terminal domain-containing protein [Candidatus Humimicrobiaceae bacterium]
MPPRSVNYRQITPPPYKNKMEIKKIPISQINPAKYNPRIDLQPGDLEYEKIKKSIDEFDLVEPLVWNKKTGNLVAGHQRLKILKDRGITEIEVSIVNLSEPREKALNIVLNKVDGAWDFPKLTELLQELDTDKIFTGFDDGEIEKLAIKFDQDEFSEVIRKSEEIKTAEETSDTIAERFSERIRDVAQQHPEKMNRALSIIVPLKKGHDVIIITDPALKDFVDELKRYAEAGEHSPLESILSQLVPMKWK